MADLISVSTFKVTNKNGKYQLQNRSFKAKSNSKSSVNRKYKLQIADYSWRSVKIPLPFKCDANDRGEFFLIRQSACSDLIVLILHSEAPFLFVTETETKRNRRRKRVIQNEFHVKWMHASMFSRPMVGQRHRANGAVWKEKKQIKNETRISNELNVYKSCHKWQNPQMVWLVASRKF